MSEDRKDRRQQRLVLAVAEAFDNHSLKIRYVVPAPEDTLTTARDITPLCFQVSSSKSNNGRLMVLAYCWERKKLRSFFIHRIKSVDPVDLKPVSTEMLCDLLLNGQFNRYERDYVPTAYAREVWGGVEVESA